MECVNMKRTFFYLLFILALVSCKEKASQKSSQNQLPVDFQTVVASDRIYRVVVDIDGNVWHWVSSNPHQDPRNEFVFTNKNIPTKPKKIETLSNVVSVSINEGVAIAVTGEGLCFKWKYCDSNGNFVYNEQPKQISSLKNVKYANPYYYNSNEGAIFVVHNDGTAEFLDYSYSEDNPIRHPIKMPNSDKIRYMDVYMILSESGKVYCIKDYIEFGELNTQLSVNLLAKNCIFVQLFPTSGSIFQNNGKQVQLQIEVGPDVTTWRGEFKTNIKFWGDSFYNMRNIRYDGILLDCLGNKVLNTDISNLIYLSGDLYLRADGTLFESIGGRYEETSTGEGISNDATPRRLFDDKIRKMENMKIYTTHLIENLPSKIDVDENKNYSLKGIYSSQ